MVVMEAPLHVLSMRALSLLTKVTCLDRDRGEERVLVLEGMFLPLTQSCGVDLATVRPCISQHRSVQKDGKSFKDLGALFACLSHGGLNMTLEDQDSVRAWLVQSLRSVGSPDVGSGSHVSSASSSVVGRSSDPNVGRLSSASASSRSRSPLSHSSGFTETLSRQQYQQQQLRIKVLESLVTDLQAQNREKDRKLKAVARKLKRAEGKHVELTDQLEAAKTKRMKKLAIERHSDRKDLRAGRIVVEGESSGWLTPEGSLSLGIRRNLSNIATSDVGPTLLMDLSRWTVSRSEVRTGACLIASSRKFWKDWQSAVYEAEGAVSLTIVSYRQDATNSAVWNKSKLCALEMKASYMVLHGKEAIDELHADSFSRIKRLADVLPVTDGSGKGAVLLTQKMLESLGVPSWRDLRPDRMGTLPRLG